MSRIKLAIAATAALLVTAPMAQAAPFEFAGFYAGVHAGYLDVEADFDSGGGTSSGDGLMGGVQAGYNVVTGNFMWGIETDLSLSNASPCCGIDASPITTLRPRIGFAVDDWLLYVTGGIAAAQFEEFDGFDGSYGWALGGGVEYLAGDIVGFKLEYRYLRFGDAIDLPVTTGISDVDFDLHVIMGGMNFHF